MTQLHLEMTIGYKAPRCEQVVQEVISDAARSSDVVSNNRNLREEEDVQHPRDEAVPSPMPDKHKQRNHVNPRARSNNRGNCTRDIITVRSTCGGLEIYCAGRTTR